MIGIRDSSTVMASDSASFRVGVAVLPQRFINPILKGQRQPL